MRKLTKEQKEYIKSIEIRQTSQDILISIHNANIENSKRMIELHTQSLKHEIKSRKHEIKLTIDGMNNFYKWCEENNITI